VPRSCTAGGAARRGGGLGRAQAELGIIPEAAGHDIDRKAHLKYLHLGALRAALASICAISGVDSTPASRGTSASCTGSSSRRQGRRFRVGVIVETFDAAHPAARHRAIRLETSRNRVIGGVGLGLTSARAIIREHDGDHRLVHSVRRRIGSAGHAAADT
jgi:hypothetical protein